MCYHDMTPIFLVSYSHVVVRSVSLCECSMQVERMHKAFIVLLESNLCSFSEVGWIQADTYTQTANLKACPVVRYFRLFVRSLTAFCD